MDNETLEKVKDTFDKAKSQEGAEEIVDDEVAEYFFNLQKQIEKRKVTPQIKSDVREMASMLSSSAPETNVDKFITNFADSKNRDYKRPTKKQLANYLMEMSGSTEEDLKEVFGKNSFVTSSRTEKTKHVKDTKYQNDPENIRKLKIDRDNELTKLEQSYVQGKFTKKERDFLKKDTTNLYNAIITAEILCDYYINNQKPKRLAMAITNLGMVVGDLKDFVNRFDEEFLNLQIESNSKEEVRRGIDAFLKNEEENFFNGTYEKVEKEMFKLKRQLETGLVECKKDIKKNTQLFADGKKFEKEVEEFRNKEENKDIVENLKAENGKDFLGYSKANWEDLDNRHNQSKVLVDESNKTFTKIDATYRQAKRHYQEVLKKIEIYFDPKNDLTR